MKFYVRLRSFFNGGIDNQPGCPPDIGTDAVPFDEGNDGMIRHIQTAVTVLFDLSWSRHMPSPLVKEKSKRSIRFITD